MRSWSITRTRSALFNWAILSTALLVVVILAEAVMSRGQVRIANQFVINVGIVVAIQSYVGTTGILSFGHVAFLCIAAYIAGLVTIPPDQKADLLPALPEWLQSFSVGLPGALGIGVIAVCVVAMLFGAPISRMRENVIPMATLALLVIIYTVVNLWDDVTRGTRGLVSVPNLVSGWSILLVSSAVILAALLFKASPWGLQAQAVREDEVAAASFGISIARTRFISWVFSAILMGAAGTMFALNSLAFSPEQFFFAETFSLLAMLIIGGMGSVSGAVIGVAAVTVLSELLRGLEQGISVGAVHIGELPGLVQFSTAVLIVVLLALRPTGLFGNRELGKVTWFSKRGTA